MSKFVKELRTDYLLGGDTKAELKFCKLCDGLMIERTSSNGKFYGFSNYPSCKGKLSV